MLTIALTAAVVSATVLITNTLIEEKTSAAAEIYAENLANLVADRIINICLVKEQYPDTNYSIKVDVPLQLMNRYNYYVEIEGNTVYVNSTNGNIQVSSEIFNAPERLYTDIKGKVYGSEGVINISCKKYDYKYKFDFGTCRSSGEKGYTRITNLSLSDDLAWDSGYLDFAYRTPITVTNPTTESLEGYQLLVTLDDTTFNYANANGDGSDLRFIDGSGNKLDYWIERWNPRDTGTSRVWVELSSPFLQGGTIYMYHGNECALPESNGTATFYLFDNFTGVSSPDSSRWDTYCPANGDISIKNGILVLKNGSAITSVDEVDINPLNYTVETKAKATGTSIREASMFVRNDGTSTPPYQHAVVFSSGASSVNNLTLIIYYGGSWLNRTSDNQPGVNQDWHRLTYIVNGDDNVICRYFYENFTVEKATGLIETSYNEDKHIGLCTVKDGTTAYYDWVFVRNYTANTSDTVTNREQAIPVAHVNCTQSLDYEWDPSADTPKSMETVGNDFVYNDVSSGSARFKIMNLTDQEYSLTFRLGDSSGIYYPDKLVENMTIDITGEGTYSITDIKCAPYSNKWITGVSPDAGGELLIEFDDDALLLDTYYWAVDKMTIQYEERAITMTGGK